MLKALTLNQWDDTDLSHQNGHQKIGPSPLGILFLWFVARGAKLFAKKYAPWPWVIGSDLYNVIFPKRIDLELQGDFSGFLEVTLYPKTNMTGWKITNLRSNIFRFCIVPLHEWFWLLFDWNAASARMLSGWDSGHLMNRREPPMICRVEFSTRRHNLTLFRNLSTKPLAYKWIAGRLGNPALEKGTSKPPVALTITYPSKISSKATALSARMVLLSQCFFSGKIRERWDSMFSR